MQLYLVAFIIFFIPTILGLSHKHHKVENKEMKTEMKGELKKGSASHETLARAWPHLSGMDYVEVEAKIRSERPDVRVVRVKQVRITFNRCVS
jgi:hypothetical protein